MFLSVEYRTSRAEVKPQSCKDLYNNMQHFLVRAIKGIVGFEINVWYVLSYLKGIQDVGVFSIFNFDIFRSNRFCLSVI